MRILFVTASYLPVTNGVTYHIQSTANALRKLGHKVFILAPSFPGFTDTDKFVIRYPSLPNPFVSTYPLGIPIVPMDKIKKLYPDIIHTHHPLIVGQYASQLAEKLKIPLFFTAHTQYEEYLNYYFPHGYNLTSKLLIRDLVNLSKKCKAVICPTIVTKNRLVRYRINNTVVVGNGVENFFYIKYKHKDLSVPTLVFTGRIEKEKNPYFLLKISRELKKVMPDFRLIIIGSGSQVKKMSQKLIQLKLGENIFLVGEVSRALLPNIYKTSHVFITPSKTEVMPLSILEAMGSALPVIVLKNSGLEEIVTDNENGYILPENPKIIAHKLKALFGDKKTLNKLSQNSYKTALKFTSQKTAEELLKIYKSN